MRPESENLNQPEISREAERPRLEHAALIIIKDDKIFMIQRPNPDEGQHRWGYSSETLEDGETPEDAVRRVAPEELGVVAQVIRDLPGDALNGHTNHIFLGELQDEVSPNPEEVEAGGYYSYAEAREKEFCFGGEQVLEMLHRLNLIK